MSGTHESALLAARDASVPVTVVDSRQVGVATGYAALSASDVLDAGGSVDEAAAAARRRADAATALFYVDTLEYLRRAAGSVPPPRCSAVRSPSSRCCGSRTGGWRTSSGSAPRRAR